MPEVFLSSHEPNKRLTVEEAGMLIELFGDAAFLQAMERICMEAKQPNRKYFLICLVEDCIFNKKSEEVLPEVPELKIRYVFLKIIGFKRRCNFIHVVMIFLIFDCKLFLFKLLIQ